MRGAWRGPVAVAMAAACAGGATAAQAAPLRVPREFFGVNAQVAGTRGWDGAPARMAGLGLGVGRIQVTWQDVQPDPARAPDWRATDAQVAALAAAGIRAQPLVAYSALWAQPPMQRVWSEQTFAPEDPATYAAFARMVVERYGRGGAFWAAHPELEALPVGAVELWNEPNSRGYFKPHPDPARYGALYRTARAAMRAVDPAIVAIVGGLHATPRGGPGPADFLAGMGDPASIDAVGVHAYGPQVAELLEPVVAVRRWLDGAGRTGVPILVTEWGWASSDETARAALFREGASTLLRSDCGVTQALAFAWVGDGHDLVHRDGTPRPALEALGDVATGADDRRATRHPCGLPAPDRDGDGVEDQHDYAPLNARVSTARKRVRPSVHDRPWLDGEAVAGGRLTARTGTYDGSPRPVLRVVRWEACDGDACTEAGPPGPDLDLSPALAGRRVRAVVEARNRLGAVTATTPLSAPVAKPADAPAPRRSLLPLPLLR